MDYYVNVDSFGISPWNTFIFYLYVVIFSLAWIWLLKCCKSRNFYMPYIHVIWSFTFVIYVISMLFKLYVLLHIYCIFICICIFNLLYISVLTLFDFKFMQCFYFHCIYKIAIIKNSYYNKNTCIQMIRIFCYMKIFITWFSHA